MQNIIAVLFEVESEGYQAITKLKQIPNADYYNIFQMALVKREGGKLSVCDSFQSGVNTVDNTIAGGVIGGLLGILGGPIGVLLMGSYGAAAGSLIDLGDAVGGISLLETVADKLQDDTFALVIYADEKEEAALDSYLGSAFKVENIVRFDAAAVAKEVEEAILIEGEMARQARMKLRQTKKEELKQLAQEKREQFEDDLEESRKRIAENAGNQTVY